MNNRENEVIKILEENNQNHIIEHMKKLNEEDKLNIIRQIEEIDFEEILNLYNKTKIQREKRNIEIKPLQTVVAKKLGQNKKNEYLEEGKKVLKQNKYAVVTMAGGQGTRLRA